MVRLTERGIKSLKAGKWLTDFWDRTLPGFGVQVSQRGHKSFVVRFTLDGSKRRHTIGRRNFSGYGGRLFDIVDSFLLAQKDAVSTKPGRLQPSSNSSKARSRRRCNSSADP